MVYLTDDSGLPGPSPRWALCGSLEFIMLDLAIGQCFLQGLNLLLGELSPGDRKLMKVCELFQRSDVADRHLMKTQFPEVLDSAERREIAHLRMGDHKRMEVRELSERRKIGNLAFKRDEDLDPLAE